MAPAGSGHQVEDAVIVAEGLAETTDRHDMLGWPSGAVDPRYFVRGTALTRSPDGICDLALSVAGHAAGTASCSVTLTGDMWIDAAVRIAQAEGGLEERQLQQQQQQWQGARLSSIPVGKAGIRGAAGV